MKIFFPKPSLVFIVLLQVSFISCAQPAHDSSSLKVIIIRHAEKPAEGDNLSCQGLNRALALPDVLYKKFNLPDLIFVPSINTGKTTGVARMYQTIVPFAVKYNLNVDTKFAVDDLQALTQSILKKTGTVLIIWEHKNIPGIAQQLGVTDANLKWKGDDFDSIWIITIKNGKAVLTIDKENLHPSAACN
jgi:hypothetical protein